MKKFFILISAFVFFFASAGLIFAEELKIVFTGQSFASLYPCSCPHEPDGGVARRATVIKNLRSAHKDVLLLEAGNSFASGPQDQNTENYEKDSRRTDVYLKSLKAMGYDAVLVSAQEYSFGGEFLKRYTDIPFVSSNIDGFPNGYLIKDFGWVKVGVLALSDSQVAAKGITGWQAPLEILEKRISELKNNGAGIIILLSSLLPQQDKELLRNIKGIDVVINGSVSYGSAQLTELDGIIYLNTWWQAKKIGVLTFDVSDSKITNKTLESLSLSPEIPDDESLSAILPQCFRAADCKKIEGSVASCENASLADAKCTYTQQAAVSVTIIRPKACRTCREELVVAGLKKVFGNLKVGYLKEDDAAAGELIKEYKITMLPAYLFAKDIEKSQAFKAFSMNLDKGKDSYMLKPSKAGVSYVLGRKRIPKRLDVFFDFDSASLPELFSLLKDFKEKHKDIDVRINFLVARAKNGELMARGGVYMIEEFGRMACIDDLYPKKVFDYLICRSSETQSSWWDTCATKSKIDPAKIKKCAVSQAGREKLFARIGLTQELEIVTGPTFLVDNAEIFAVVNAPSLEEFEKVVLQGGPDERVKTK